MLKKFFASIDGYKTHILAALSIAYFIGQGWKTGDWSQVAPYIVGSGFASTFRSAFAKFLLYVLAPQTPPTTPTLPTP